MLSSSSTKRTTSVRSVNTHLRGMLTRMTDNVCIESLSIDLTRPMLDSAARSVIRLGDKIDECVCRASDLARG